MIEKEERQVRARERRTIIGNERKKKEESEIQADRIID
jgi:hypothetical protein